MHFFACIWWNCDKQCIGFFLFNSFYSLLVKYIIINFLGGKYLLLKPTNCYNMQANWKEKKIMESSIYENRIRECMSHKCTKKILRRDKFVTERKSFWSKPLCEERYTHEKKWARRKVRALTPQLKHMIIACVCGKKTVLFFRKANFVNIFNCLHFR